MSAARLVVLALVAGALGIGAIAAGVLQVFITSVPVYVATLWLVGGSLSFSLCILLMILARRTREAKARH